MQMLFVSTPIFHSRWPKKLLKWGFSVRKVSVVIIWVSLRKKIVWLSKPDLATHTITHKMSQKDV
jgi:hypothetical protein